ncbi:MAG: tRNA 2-selenouridine(34) synthase MnmH [Verrucomicrobiales bacterium]|nr:tRNA 2-selenouridine(34) synthase MnmH [Verrucomicrobiales bacterium]
MRHIKPIQSKDIHLAEYDDVIDVRSPLEFAEDNLPGSINLPVLSNSEREEVGTIYKQMSPFEARRRGAALVSHNIAEHLNNYFFEKEKDYSPLIYCWRGGERSRSIATILESIGWKPVLLEGGYQAYRKHIVESFDKLLQNNFHFKIISGLTGSGKTKLLKQLNECGMQIINLEGLAAHRGSALGEETSIEQPSQKKFERLLYEKILSFSIDQPIFLESESSRIGNLQIPSNFWTIMKSSPVLEINVDRKYRVDFLLREYPHFTESPDLLKSKLEKIKHLKIDSVFNTWISMVEENNHEGFVHSILKDHYDAAYLSSRRKTYSREPDHTFSLNEINDQSLNQLAKEIAGSLSS